jgi:hypothetical protein
MGGGEFGEDFARAVAGTIVDADQFKVDWDGQDPGYDFAESGLLVVDGHYDGEFHGARSKVRGGSGKRQGSGNRG